MRAERDSSARSAASPGRDPSRDASGPTLLGWALWLAAVATGFAAQLLLNPLADNTLGGVLYAAAALAAIAGAALLDRRSPLPAPRPADGDPPRWFSYPRLALLLACLSATAAAVTLLAQQHRYGTVLLLWLAALATATAAMADPRAWRFPQVDRERAVRVALVVAVLLLAVALRLPDLSHVPPEVHGDEAACGLEARRILHGEVPNLFTLGWYHIPYMSFAISAASMWVFGDDLFGLRMASVVQGTLSVLLLFLIARRLFSFRIALLASFLLAVSHWHIHFSRSGISYMQALFAALLVFHFLLRGLERLRLADFLFAGFAAGLCFEVYYSARLAPFLAGLYLLFRIVRERGFLRRQWRGMLTMALGAILFLAPIGVVYVTHPDTLLTRTSGVLILAESNLQHAYYSYKVDSPQDVLLVQAVNTLKAFTLRGETSGQHARRAPLIDFWSGVLFVLGAAVATARFWRDPYFLVCSWFWLTLLFGSVLTVDAMFSPRVIIVVPVLFLFPALFLDTGWRAAEQGGRRAAAAFRAAVLAFLALATWANVDAYFNHHVKLDQTGGFDTLVSRYVLAVNDRYRVYLMGKADTSLRYDTEKFLLTDVDGVDVRDATLELPLDRLPAEKGVAFVVAAGLPTTAERLDALRRAYPDGREVVQQTVRREDVFTSYLVEHESLLAARPDAVLDHEPIRATLLSQIPPARSAEEVAAGTQPSAAATPVTVGAGGAFTPPDPREPRAVAVAANGDVYLLDRLNGSVHRFDAEGRLINAIGELGDGPGLLADPRALAIEQDGNLLVLDARGNLVSRFTPDGRFLANIALPGGYNPTGLGLDRDGAILVADTGLSRVVRLRAGAEPQIIGAPAEGRGRLEQPVDVAVSPDGEIYVVDLERVVVFGPDGEYRRDWPIPKAGTFYAAHIAIVLDGVLLSNPEGRMLARYDREGRKLADGCGGMFERPTAIALDRDGSVLVVDTEARRLRRCPRP